MYWKGLFVSDERANNLGRRGVRICTFAKQWWNFGYPKTDDWSNNLQCATF